MREGEEGEKDLGGTNQAEPPEFLQKFEIYMAHLNWSIFKGGKKF